MSRLLAVAFMSLGAVMPVAAGPVILEVTGQITDGRAVFDHAALADLPPAALDTSTVVTDGVHHFEGFLMRDLLDFLHADGEVVTAIALNDYRAEIPVSDFTDFDVLVAMKMDGAPLTRDDKGPLWIVYPRDAHSVLQDIRFDYRWVWQLSELHVE